MSDDEFDLLDELYFLQSYDQLKEETGWDDHRLLAVLGQLYIKEYIKCYHAPDQEVFDGADLNRNGASYYYLATKKGLLKHNAL
ncbi:hypothetical protein [Lunatimonas salinarum]|uniref:hypothetical protein n=1 Tax=Lunatimonas salinarum TaxID=1774590 RepID=UPI001AE0ABC3|nr:hypothetical protein [Lunatimonas salinarum]